jgi:GDP-4-dehydro-6-deoxy-D-mannose reductase
MVFSRHADRIGDILSKIEFCAVANGYNDYGDRVRQFAPTHVIHLAWEGGNAYKDVNDVQQFYSNLPDGIDLLRILASLPTPPQFVGVGSFSEYGRLTSRASETQADAPVTLYGVAKSTFKTLSRKFCEDNGMVWTWVRPCYIYGPHDVPTRLIPRVVLSLLTQTPVHLDSCESTLDYLHVDDFCRAMLLLLSTQTPGIVNVCSGTDYILRDVLALIVSLVGLPSTFTFDSTRERTSLSTYAVGDPATLIRLGWSPTVTLEEGLNTVIREIKHELFLKTTPVDYDGLHGLEC